MNSMTVRRFSINGLDYVASITKSGSFTFHLAGGSTRKGTVYHHQRDRYDLFPEERLVEDIDLNPYALPVLRKAGEILLEWMHKKNPWHIHFSASTPRKIRIYRWLAKRLVKKQLGGYQLVEYPEGVFNFYRLVSPSDVTLLVNETTPAKHHKRQGAVRLRKCPHRENLLRYCHPAFWALGRNTD